jgi:hypothetical protein
MMDPLVQLRLLKPQDGQTFIRAVASSVALHSPWVTPPATVSRFDEYMASTGQECVKFGIWSAHEQLVGVVNVNAIIRGHQGSSNGVFVAVATKVVRPERGGGLWGRV